MVTLSDGKNDLTDEKNSRLSDIKFYFSSELLLDRQKRTDIIMVDLVMVVLLATSGTFFMNDISYYESVSEVGNIQYVFSSLYGYNILFTVIYFIFLQFYEPDRFSSWDGYCDFCLIFRLFFVTLSLFLLLSYKTLFVFTVADFVLGGSVVVYIIIVILTRLLRFLFETFS